jgi:hypothetical protein
MVGQLGVFAGTRDWLGGPKFLEVKRSCDNCRCKPKRECLSLWRLPPSLTVFGCCEPSRERIKAGVVLPRATVLVSPLPSHMKSAILASQSQTGVPDSKICWLILGPA